MAGEPPQKLFLDAQCATGPKLAAPTDPHSAEPACKSKACHVTFLPLMATRWGILVALHPNGRRYIVGAGDVVAYFCHWGIKFVRVR